VALARYRHKHRKKLSGHHRIISDFSEAGPYNPIERLMYSAAARDERAARRFHAFGSRRIGVREFLAPKVIAHALLVNARHAAKRRKSRKEARSDRALAGRVG
jgi:hypothetical protein